MPRGSGGRLVFVKPEAHADRDTGEKFAEAQIGRRVVNRIAAEDEKILHASGLHGGRQFRDGCGRSGLGAHAAQGLARSTERIVDGQAERLQSGRLLVADNYDTFAGRCGEVLGAFGDPLGIGGKRTFRERGDHGRQIGIAGQRGDLLCESAEEGANLGRLHAHPMVGHAAGRRIMRLGDVKPVHRLTRLADAAARHEAAHLVEPAEGRIEKIAVDGENFVRAAEIGNYDSVCAEARSDGGIGFIRAERFVFGPEQVREFLTKLLEQTVPRGRGVAFGEEGQTGASVGRSRGGDFVEFGAKRGGIALCP